MTQICFRSSYRRLGDDRSVSGRHTEDWGMTQIWFRSSYRRLGDDTDMFQVVIQKTGG